MEDVYHGDRNISYVRTALSSLDPPRVEAKSVYVPPWLIGNRITLVGTRDKEDYRPHHRPRYAFTQVDSGCAYTVKCASEPACGLR